MFTRVLVCLSLLAVVGCGGDPVSSSMPTGADLCALNPLASSCTNVESVQSAVFGPPDFTNNKLSYWGQPSTYDCSGPGGTIAHYPLDTTKMGGNLHVWKEASTGLWKGRAEAISFVGTGITASLSVAPLLQFDNAMDGSYHVAYNGGPWGYTENVCIHTWWHPACMLGSIPPYGFWLYAKGERPDYPNGVQIVTIDAVHPSPADGACNGRMQFVVPL